MSLLKYFKKERKEDVHNLPDPQGSLSSKVPSSSISSANEEVRAVLKSPAIRAKGYDRFTPEEKATIARGAKENGVTRTVVKHNKRLEVRTLKESTVRTWVSEYSSFVDVLKLNFQRLCQNSNPKEEEDHYSWVRNLIVIHGNMWQSNECMVD